MYEIILTLNILWEIALTLWPWLLGLAVIWLIALALAARQPRSRWIATIRPTAILAIAVGVVVFLISPTINLATFADATYWVDWANLIGFAAGTAAGAFVWLWPIVVWASGKIKPPAASISI